MKLFLRVFSRVKPYRFYLLGSMVCTILFASLSSVSIWMLIPFMENIFKTEVVERTRAEKALVQTKGSDDHFLAKFKRSIRKKTNQLVSADTREGTLKRLCLIILAAYFLKNLFHYGQGYLMSYVEQGVARDFRDSIYEHFHRLSLEYFHGHRTGQLISRVTNDVGLLNEAINASLINLIREPLLILFYLGIVVILSWQLALVAFIIMPLSFFIISKVGAKLRKHSARSQMRMADITSVLQETFSGIRVVKAFSMEKFEVGKFRRETGRLFKTMIRMSRVRRLAAPSMEFLGALAGVVILWIGGMQVLKGGLLRPEEFITFLGAIFLSMHPIKNLSQVNNKIQVGLAAAQRLFEVLDTQPRIFDSDGAAEIKGIEGSIRFVNVSFRYEKGDVVLKDINLEVKTGEILAIIGPSGAGKSTLVDLIPRFYDPTGGFIEVDGVDIRKVKIHSLRSLMGIVTQETVLFNDTVWNNIAYGLSDVFGEKVMRASLAANAHQFISQLPEGYQTTIGDRGVRLSGGEKQRLAIARAILKDPPILIFDEATSALDTESEALVQEAIQRLIQDRTVFVIAHRLSTIQNATRIIVLNEGRIVQEGSHKELLAQEGLYRRLYEMQFRDMSEATS